MFRRGARTAGAGSEAELVVLGLCNPGSKFEGTRHNVGGDAVELLAKRADVSLRAEKGTYSRLVAARLGSHRVVLARSETYMNDSGLAATNLVKRYLEGDVARLVVVHDELDLPPGVVRVKFGGGTAGHNGLRSIEQHVKSLEFARVRIGIGKPVSKEHGARHVLARAGGQDAELLKVGVEVAADAVEQLAEQGIEAAMTTVNGRP